MKLSLLSETDEELRSLARRARSDPGDSETLLQALRAHQRARGNQERILPGIASKSSKLRKMGGPRWNPDHIANPRAGEIYLSFDWDPNQLSRDEGLSKGMYALWDYGANPQGFDIVDEGEGWIALNVDVDEDFIEHLSENGFVDFNREGVRVQAEWP